MRRFIDDNKKFSIIIPEKLRENAENLLESNYIIERNNII